MTFHDELDGPGIDIDRESVLTFSQAAAFVGRLKGQRPVALQTLFRWCTRGRSGVLLERIYIGGTPCTSKEALQRFFSRLTLVATRDPLPGGETESARIPDRLGDVDQLLRRAGIDQPSQEDVE